MKRFGIPMLLLAGLFSVAPVLGHGPILPQYQEVVVIEPIPGGGGGAICWWELIFRHYPDGSMFESDRRMVCVPSGV